MTFRDHEQRDQEPPTSSPSEARRAARQSWPIRRYDLGDEPADDLSSHTTASQRFAMVWPLTVLSWRLAGRSIPEYERSEMPGRIERSNASS